MAEKKKMRGEASSSRNNMGGENINKGESVVMDVGRQRSPCGYCGSVGATSIIHGLGAHSLTVDDYQALLDRGWRRSGCFLYKPEMERTCCPSYTIRLKASEFVPSKDQLRVSKRIQRFLDGTLDMRKAEKSTDEPTTSKGPLSYFETQNASSVSKESSTSNLEEKHRITELLQQLSDKIDIAVQSCIANGEFSCHLQLPKASVKIVAPAKRKLLVEGSEELLFSCNISFQISAALRRAKKDVDPKNIVENNVEGNGQSAGLTSTMIAEILVRHLKGVAESNGLSIRACNGHINFYSTANQTCSDDMVKTDKRSKVHSLECGIKESCLKKSHEIPQTKRRRLEIHLKRSSYDPEEYALYRKYQLKVHNDTPDGASESSYRRFLVDTPLIFVPPIGDGTVPSCGFGSFHQQYVIDGQLVAVGVIDILPKCLSSKYLFWDPDLAFLSLGKYSALEEIRWVKENQMHCPSLQYYYLGYYIHSCNKMRYKAAYGPSELLCPLRYQWIPFEIAKPLLDRKRYVVLSDFATLQKEELLPPLLKNDMEEQHEDPFHEGKNDIFVDKDEEMDEFDSEDSGDELDPEALCVSSAAEGAVDVRNVLIGIKSSRLRYKDLCQAFGSGDMEYIEMQLRRYVRAVGIELSGRMVYSLG